MANRASLAAALPLVLCGCRASADIVAAYSGAAGYDGGTAYDGGAAQDGDTATRGDAAYDGDTAIRGDAAQDGDASTHGDYGAYDPDHPPQVIGGGIQPITDPTLFSWQDTYWVFSSGTGILVHSTKDLNTFKTENPVFAQNPSWIADKITAFTVRELWSPYVVLWGTTFHLYYAASSFTSDCACIGHATAPSTGSSLTFTDDQSPVICSNLSSTCVDNSPPGTENFTAIDPAVIEDGTGSRWMVFGSWGSGIQMIALDSSGKRRDPSTKPVPVAARAASEPKGIQAASLFRWRDYYYLFVSPVDSSSNHFLRVGRAKKMSDPFLDSDGKNMADGGGRLVLQGNDQFKGPGSNMVFDDGTRLLNVYHAFDATVKDSPGILRIAQLVFDSNGWPVSGGP